MDNKEQGNTVKPGKWEVTLLFIGLLLSIALALVGWYMDGNVSLPK